MPGRVYSYMRFSTPEQSRGHSLQRQTDYATQYAQANGLMLDEALTMRDEGLSAYHQKHVTKGALGAFYRAVEEGMVDPGSVLIVENLDRLSRANPRNALPYFLNIINAGITVVIAKDGKSYSQESIDNNPFQLFESLIEMVRANSESEHKSQRVKASIVGQIKQWLDHGHGKIIRNGADPYWVKPKDDRTGFDLIDNRVVIIREIISLAMKGWGAMKIQRHLNDNYKPFKGLQWYSEYISSVTKNRVLIGERSFCINETDYVIKNYYPAIISDSDFALLQHEIKNRAPTKAQQKIPSLVTGNKISFCGHCGTRLTAQNHKARSYNGKLYPITGGLRRIRCNSRMKGADCPNTALNSKSIAVSISAQPIEHALLEYCSNQMELSSILNDDNDKSLTIKAKIGDLRLQSSDAETVVENGNQQITKLLLQGEDAAPISNVVKQQQSMLDDIQSKIRALEDDLRYQKVHKSSDLIAEWEKTKKNTYNMDEDTRLIVRQIIKKTFKRMDIYFHSFNKSHLGKTLNLPIDDQSIVMLLTFINDKTRLLAIDRKTGDWVTHRDFKISESSVLSGLGVDPAHLDLPAP